MNVDGVAPDAPGDVVVEPDPIDPTNPSTRDIKISWNPVVGADGYRIERSFDNGEWVAVGDVTGTSFVDAGLDITIATKFSYRIQAYNTSENWKGWDGSGVWSLPVNFMVIPEQGSLRISVDQERTDSQLRFDLWKRLEDEKSLLQKNAGEVSSQAWEFSNIDLAQYTAITFFLRINREDNEDIFPISNSEINSYDLDSNSLNCRIEEIPQDELNEGVKFAWRYSFEDFPLNEEGCDMDFDDLIFLVELL